MMNLSEEQRISKEIQVGSRSVVDVTKIPIVIDVLEASKTQKEEVY